MSVDPRFFTPLGALALGEIASRTGAALTGDADIICDDLGASSSARSGELCFHEGDAAGAADVSPDAGACFVREDAAGTLPKSVPALITDRPRYAHALAANAMFAVRTWASGSDTIAASASIHETVTLSPGVVVGENAAIGEGADIGPNAVIGPGVQIGRGTRIGANTSVMCALIGDDVSIGAGVRIGEPGFGTISGPDGVEDAPQFGRVIIQDHCRIGGNTCIDRGAFGDTVLGERTKIDNLCQIAHNVTTGHNVIMAAFCGISGSVSIGDGAMLGGQVGVANHVNVGVGSALAASAGALRDIPDGETWGGTPAQPIRQWLREVAWLQKQIKPKKKPAE